MLNKEYVADVLPFLVRGSMAKNARQFSYQIVDFSVPFNVFGFRIDPEPFEGNVVAYDYGGQLMLIKLGGKPLYRVLDLAHVTSKPAIGKKVRITPYARRDWNGERLDKPNVVEGISRNGKPYRTYETILGGRELKLPIPETSNFELNELVKQLEMLPAPDGFRNIVHLLADANATQFEVNEKNQSIAFYVDTQKHQGKVEIVYDRASDSYAVILTSDGIVNDEVDDIYFDRLGSALSYLIDDLEWRKIKVEVI